MKKAVLLFSILILSACTQKQEVNGTMFKDDLSFLKKYTDVIVLKGENEKAQVAAIPGQQGRVMTSTAGGPDGLSFGWINRELIESGENNKHINAFGGEDRFWLGPEGGQFSIFFEKGDPFDLDHWWTPEPINEGAYDIVKQNDEFVQFKKEMQIKNYSGTQFDLELKRAVQLLSVENVNETFGADFDGLDIVAFESENIITNTGDNAWEKETGLLSIWILGMYNPSPSTTIVIPFKGGDEAKLGPKVNDAYFGKVPEDRLLVKDDVLFFSGDGEYRSKIGLSPYRATSVLGSYDATNNALTLVTYTMPENATDYVNSMWEIQDEPFAGDVVNSYNDGPPEPGAKPLGPFYELETSSPAAALAAGESMTHTHTTVHLVGDKSKLDEIAQSVLGVSLQEIEEAF